MRLHIFLLLNFIGQLRPWPVCAYVQAGQHLCLLYTGYHFDYCALTWSMRCLTCSICSLTHLSFQDTLLVCLSYVAEHKSLVKLARRQNKLFQNE